MVVSLSKDATLATIAAFVVFATPFTLMRAADFEGSATHGVAQRWSLASCCVHRVALDVRWLLEEKLGGGQPRF